MQKQSKFFDDDGVVVENHKGKPLTEEGAEIPDPRPMAPPVGFVRQQPLHERIRAMVQAEFLRVRADTDVESPEEADDFDVDDDTFDPRSPYEHNFDPPVDGSELHKRLVDAGWTPPEPARAPSGGATAVLEPSRSATRVKPGVDSAAGPASDSKSGGAASTQP